MKLYWSQKYSNSLSRKSVSFSKYIWIFKINSKLLCGISERKLCRKFHLRCDHLKTYLSQKNFQVLNTKSASFSTIIKNFEINSKISRDIDVKKPCKKNYWAMTSRKYLKFGSKIWQKTKKKKEEDTHSGSIFTQFQTFI